jgi:hypothetical protein
LLSTVTAIFVTRGVAVAEGSAAGAVRCGVGRGEGVVDREGVAGATEAVADGEVTAGPASTPGPVVCPGRLRTSSKTMTITTALTAASGGTNRRMDSLTGTGARWLRGDMTGRPPSPGSPAETTAGGSDLDAQPAG